jgi:hypothetical protein
MPICRERPPEMHSRAADGSAAHTSACFYVDENPEADLLAVTKKPEKDGARGE